MPRLTAETVNSLNLGLPTVNNLTVLYVESALSWVEGHTTVNVDYDNLGSLPANVLLFVAKYFDLLSLNNGIASESIEGMSQSFVTGQSLESKIYELALALLGDVMKSTVTVFSGEDRWDYGS